MRNTTRVGRRSTGRYVALGAVALSLVAAACGSSATKAVDTPTTTTGTATTKAEVTTTKAAEPAASTATTAAPAVTTTAAKAPAGEKPVAGGDLKVGQESGVSTLDPALALAQPADKNIALAIYDPLMSFDKDGKFIPFLAEAVKNSDDLKVWTVTLRKGVKFHDGTDFNAEAVVAHYKRMADPATKSAWATEAGTTYGVPTKTDDYTVVWNMSTPQIGFPNALAGVMGYIPSPTAVAKDPTGFGLAPVGTGPFKITKFEAGGEVVVEKNPTYWRKAENGDTLPYLNKITFTGIPDSGKRLTAVQNGEVDLIQTADTATVIQAEKAKLKVIRVSGSSSTVMLFNNAKEPTSDVRVRQAMSYATDKAELNQVLYEGARTESYSAFAPDSPFFNKNVQVAKYDPEKAKALLKEYGKPVEVVLECIPTPEAEQILQIIQQQWEKVGIKSTIKTQEQGAYVGRIFGKVGDWTTACFRTNHFVEPDQIRGGLETDNKANLIFYSNKELDKVLAEGNATTDFAKRKAAYDKAQEILAKDVPTMPTLYDIFGNISNDKVFGVPPSGERNSLGAIQLAGVWKKA
jgi:peptide/nickel transport system substrate-binding protein